MKADELIEIIGETDDRHILDADKRISRRAPRWAKYTAAAIAVCLCLVIGSICTFRHPGGRAGAGGDTDLHYMYYTGPVLPLTVQGESNGITAARNIDFDFSPYISVEQSYEDNGITHSYLHSDSESLVTDRYTLYNETGTAQTLRLLYPFVGNLDGTDYWPTITVDGIAAKTALHPGPYSGGFQGVLGGSSAETGSVNLKPLDCFEGYEALLSDNSYQASAFDAFPALDQTVTIYRLHDFIYSADSEAGNPSLSMEFYIDYDKTMVFSYGMNGASYDRDSGYCARRKGAIGYRPNVDKQRQHPDDGYVILLGEDIESYALQGYRNMGCHAGEELDDLGCTVTRYEATLGEILQALFTHFLIEYRSVQDALNAPPTETYSMDLYMDLTAELLYSYGMLGESPVQRYDTGILEDIFSAVLSHSRVIYLAFDVTIPAGGIVTIEAAMRKDGSTDYAGRDKGKDGYELATQLGSALKFTMQSASITHYDAIEIVNQNFGFDLENSCTEVQLDLSQAHYWLEIAKLPVE